MQSEEDVSSRRGAAKQLRSGHPESKKNLKGKGLKLSDRLNG
jgi:hypothetical protein